MEEKTGAKKADKQTSVLAIAFALVLVFSLVQAVQLSSLSKSLSPAGLATGSGTGALDTTGWTAEEKMNYEMHGIIPARVKSGSSSSSGGMVGGC